MGEAEDEATKANTEPLTASSTAILEAVSSAGAEPPTKRLKTMGPPPARPRPSPNSMPPPPPRFPSSEARAMKPPPSRDPVTRLRDSSSSSSSARKMLGPDDASQLKKEGVAGEKGSGVLRDSLPTTVVPAVSEGSAKVSDRISEIQDQEPTLDLHHSTGAATEAKDAVGGESASGNSSTDSAAEVKSSKDEAPKVALLGEAPNNKNLPTAGAAVERVPGGAPYVIPPWSQLPVYEFKLEILKEGSIFGTLDV